MSDIDVLATRLLGEMKNIFFKENTLTTSNVFTLVCSAMECVEKYRGLSGPDKKLVVLSMLKQAIDIYVDEPEFTAISSFIDNYGSYFIDTVVSLNSTGLKINKLSCFSKLNCCIFTTSPAPVILPTDTVPPSN